jgi:hypothetical protein
MLIEHTVLHFFLLEMDLENLFVIWHNISSLLLGFWTLSNVRISTNQKTQRFGNRSSFRKVVFSGLWKSG